MRGSADPGVRRIMAHVRRVAEAIDSYAAAPLPVQAPLQAAAEAAAPALIRSYGLKETEEDVTAYLLLGWLASMRDFDPNHLRAWREREDEQDAPEA